MYDDLVGYLQSGEAWILVGSGPSIEMGYPNWQDLAAKAVRALRSERPRIDLAKVEAAQKQRDYPKVFELVESELGLPMVRRILDEVMKGSATSKIYSLICRWPISVYLTTNYDNEIQRHLASYGEAYQTLGNSEDHLSYLNANPKKIMAPLENLCMKLRRWS